MILERRGVEFFISDLLDQENSLATFGEKLRLERERKNITLEQISVATKIAIRMLRAIEAKQLQPVARRYF